MFAGALFDLDGTLLDSESYIRGAYVVVLARRRHDFSAFDYDSILGLPDRTAVQTVLTHYGLADEPDAFYAEWKVVAEDLVERYAAPCLGAWEVLERFRAERIPMGVATSSPEPYMIRMLMKCNFLQLFKATRSVDSIGRARGKPKPDIYLEAAKDIGIDPGDCIGFEDAPAGVAALKAAGMFAVGIAASPSTAGRLIDEGADIVVPNLLNFDWNAIHK